MTEDSQYEDPDDRCPACHDTECCGAGPYTLDEKLAELRKQLADARAEYMLVESALVDAMGTLQFYADEEHWRRLSVEEPMADLDAGKRARVLLDRIFDRLVAFARIQKLKDPR